MILLLLAFIGLGSAASIINPLHEATDELRHYRFVRYIAVNHSLPVQGKLDCSAQGHHPPLYYAISAAATAWIDTGREICHTPEDNPFWNYHYWEVGDDNKNQYLHNLDEAFPWRGEALAAHIARAVNVLIGAGVVWMSWLIGRAIWPERPALSLGGAAFVAFNPMFVYMSGAVNNDIIAAFSGAAVTLASVRLLRDEKGLSRRWGLILGALFGMALMSKFNLAAIALSIEAAVTWTAWRRKQWRLWWTVNILITAMTLLTAGWWFARNMILYGEPTGFEMVTELWGARNPADSWGLAFSELPYAWTSLWGRFGYGQVPLPEPIYAGLRWLALIAAVGLPIPFLRRRQEAWPQDGIPLLLLLLNVALFFAVLFSYLLVSPAGPMGRFFFPALPSLALLMFYGLAQWAQLLPAPGKAVAALTAIITTGMGALTVVALFGYLASAFARPESFAADAAIPNPIDAQFDTLVNLRGYQIDRRSVHPGDTLRVDLYWEVTGQPPGKYLLFMHLIDEEGTMISQRDTHPGLGNFPSDQWRPGDRFIESISMTVPETAYTNSRATLSVGLYAPGAYRLGITAADGTGLGDDLPLTTVKILPDSTAYPNPQSQNFNDELLLVGYEYSSRQLRAGDSLAVSLYWQALRQQPEDKRLVQLKLINAAGAAVASVVESLQSDGTAENWEAEQLFTGLHQLQLAAGLPAGAYTVELSVLDAATKEAQNIVAEDGHWIDNRLLLAGVYIQP